MFGTMFWISDEGFWILGEMFWIGADVLDRRQKEEACQAECTRTDSVC
jgi:hypothetical protein